MHLVKGNLLLLRMKKHSEESIALLIAAASNREHPPVPGLVVMITDLTTNETAKYPSIRKAAAFSRC